MASLAAVVRRPSQWLMAAPPIAAARVVVPPMTATTTVVSTEVTSLPLGVAPAHRHRRLLRLEHAGVEGTTARLQREHLDVVGAAVDGDVPRAGGDGGDQTGGDRLDL